MIKEQPQVEPKAKYELRDAAKVLEVSKSSIAKWTEKGLLRARRKRVNGRRFWTGAELLRLWSSQI